MWDEWDIYGRRRRSVGDAEFRAREHSALGYKDPYLWSTNDEYRRWWKFWNKVRKMDREGRYWDWPYDD